MAIRATMNSYRQRGVAIITAILVVALVASTSAYLAWQNQVRIHQMENMKAQAQAGLLARAAIDWGRAVLANDAASSTVDSLSEQWATVVPAQEADGGKVGGYLTDQQGLFNLNNLVWGGVAYPADVARFRRLLEVLQLPLDLANALTDWLDTDSSVSYPGGAEDVDYLAMEPSYRAANRLLIDVGELYRVKGFNSQVIERLRPFVTALPERTSVNMNTAPREVLTAMLDSGNPADAAEIIVTRKTRPVADRQDFTTRLPKVAMFSPDNSLEYGSRYFFAESHARFGAAYVRYQALLQRNGSNWPTLLWIKQI